MHKKNDADTRNDVMELMERRELSDAVHSEPMHATLGEDPEVVASLREQLGDAGENETTDRARARLARSVKALRSTVSHSATELTAALRGTGNCAVAWLRAEVRNMRSTRLPGDALSQN